MRIGINGVRATPKSPSISLLLLEVTFRALVTVKLLISEPPWMGGSEGFSPACGILTLVGKT
jgi:hypothetical protein